MNITRYSYHLSETEKMLLGDRANNFVEHVLLEHSKSYFSSELLRKYSQSVGITFTRMPIGTKIDSVNEFMQSVFMYGCLDRDESYKNTDLVLTELIALMQESNLVTKASVQIL